jgi:hypothetical protein
MSSIASFRCLTILPHRSGLLVLLLLAEWSKTMTEKLYDLNELSSHIEEQKVFVNEMNSTQ